MADLYEQLGVEPSVETEPVDLYKKLGVSVSDDLPIPKTIPLSESEFDPLSVSRTGGVLDKQQFKQAQQDAQEAREYFAQQKTQAETALLDYYTPDEVAKIKQNPRNFINAWQFSQRHVPFYGALSEGAKNLELSEIAEKAAAGEALSDTELKLFHEKRRDALEEIVRPSTLGGDVASATLETLPYMVEFGLAAATGGLSGGVVAARMGTTLAATKLGQAGVVGSKFAGTAASLPTLYVPKYAERRLNNYMAITDKGDIIFRNAEESPLRSAFMTAAFTSAEVAAELSGGMITRAGARLVDPITGRLKTPIVSAAAKLPPKLQRIAYETYRTLKPNAKLSEFLSTHGWHGAFAEFSEEQLVKIYTEGLNLALEEGYTFDDFLDNIVSDKRQYLVEAGVIAMLKGGQASANIMTNMLRRKGMAEPEIREILDNTSATEKDAFVSKTLLEPESEYVSMPEGVIIDYEYDQTLGTSIPVYFNPPKGVSVPDIRGLQPEQVIEAVKPEELQLEQPVILPEYVKSPEELTGLPSEVVGLLGKAKQTLEYIKKQTAFLDSEGNTIKYFQKEYGYKPKRLVQFIKEYGGIYDSGGELSGRGITAKSYVGLLRKDRKIKGQMDAFGTAPMLDLRNWQSVANAAFDAGYFPHHSSYDDISMSEFFDAIAEDLNTKSFYDSKDRIGMQVAEEVVRGLDEDLYRLDAMGITADTPLEEVAKILYDNGFEPIDESTQPLPFVGWTLGATDSDGQYQAGQAIFDFANEALKKEQDKNGLPKVDAKEATFNELKRLLVDDLYAIKKVSDKALERGKNINKQKTAEFLARMYAGTVSRIMGELQTFTQTKNAEGNYVRTGEGLKPILDDFDNYFIRYETSRKQRKTDLDEYMKARRYLGDLLDLDDVTVTEKQKEESFATMVRLSAKYGQSMDMMDSIATRLYEFQARVLSQYVSSGLKSQEWLDTMLNKHKNFIPFGRIIDDIESEFGGLSRTMFSNVNTDKAIQKMKGSERELKSSIDRIVRKSFLIYDAAARNEVANAIADLADTVPEYIQKKPKGDIPKGWESFVATRNGKKQQYIIHESLAASVKSMGYEQLSVLQKIWRAVWAVPAQIARTTATTSFEFLQRAIFRETFTAAVLTKAQGGNFSSMDLAKGFFAVLGNTDLYREWQRNGGQFNGYMDISDKGLERLYDDLTSDRWQRIVRSLNPLRGIMEVGQSTDEITRVAAFNGFIRAGYTPIEAAAMSRDIHDYTRGGAATKKVNRYLPFVRSAVEGNAKLVRTFKEHPKAMTLFAMGAITLPQILLTGYYLYAADDEEREEYLEISPQMRRMFWPVKIDGQWHYYPKPFQLGYIFGSVPEDIMLWMYDGNKPEGERFWKDYARGTLASFSPIYDEGSAMPTTLRMVMEYTNNWNYFYGKPIYPRFMEDLPNEQKVTLSTSETAKLIGGVLDEPPALIQNLGRSLLTGWTPYVTKASDGIIEYFKGVEGEINEKPDNPTRELFRLVFLQNRPIGYRSNSVGYFFERYDRLETAYKGSRNVDDNKYKKYMDKYGFDIDMYHTMKPYKEDIRDISKQMFDVYDNASMTGEEKQEAITEYEEQMTRIAKQANLVYKEIRESAQ